MLNAIKINWNYNFWATSRIISALETFSEEEFLRDLGDGCGSIRSKLAHITSADSVWLERIVNNPAPKFLPPEEYTSIKDWTEKTNSIHERYRNIINTLNSEMIKTIIHYKNLKGADFSTPLAEILLHTANHATYHRGQAASLIRRIKGNPPVTDMIEYFRSSH